MVVAAPERVAEPAFLATQVAYRVLPPSESGGLGAPTSLVIEGPGEPGMAAIQPAAIDAGAQAMLAELADRARRDSERYPGSARLLISWGLALLNSGEPEKAAEVLGEAIRIMPENGLATIGLAQALARTSQRAKAEKLLRARIKSTTDPTAEFLLGHLLLTDEGGKSRAVEYWMSIANRYPDSGVPRFFLGVALLVQDRSRVAESIACFRSAVRSDVRSGAFHNALAVAYAVAGRRRDAENEFMAALHLRPTLVEAVDGLTRLLVEAEELQSAREFLSARIEHHATEVRSYELLAWVCYQMGDHQSARGYLYQALRLKSEEQSPDPDDLGRILSNLGVVYWNLRDAREAIGLFKRAIDLAPADPAPWANLAGILVADGKLSEARRIGQAGLGSFPESPELHMALAAAAAMSNETEVAVMHGRLAVEYGHASRAYVALGGYLSDLRGHTKEAIALLREGLRRYPEDEMLVNNLAYGLLMMGSVNDAAKNLDMLDLPSLSPESAPYVHATLGLLAIKRGDLDTGRKRYGEAASLAQKGGSYDLAREIEQKLHLELARALIALNRPQDAAAEISAGLRIRGRAGYRVELESLQPPAI